MRRGEVASLPVGHGLPDWTPPPAPQPLELAGHWARLQPLSPAHAADLFEECCGPERAPLWTYLASDVPVSRADHDALLARRAADPAQVTEVVVPRVGPAAGRATGLASLMRAEPAHGVVEVGAILFGPSLQRTTAATEATYLLTRHVFDLGYRRLEWKCDSLNAASRSAAARLGFTYEGTFRQAVVYRGRNRDTAWFAITDGDWRRLRPAYERWLDPAGFAEPGTGRGQRESLRALTAAALNGDPLTGDPVPGRVTDAGTAIPDDGTPVTLA